MYNVSVSVSVGEVYSATESSSGLLTIGKGYEDEFSLPICCKRS